MMQLVERHIIKDSKDLHEICAISKRLYNQCLFYLRQSYFGKIQYFTEYELTGLLAKYNDPDYRSLPAQSSQQTIKLLFKNWWSWAKSLKEYKKHPLKYSARPKMPGYKKEQFPVYFTKQQIKVKQGIIKFEKQTIPPLKTKIAFPIKQVRVIPQTTCHIIEVIYEKEITDLKLNTETISFILYS